jgi:hypothetical protein
MLVSVEIAVETVEAALAGRPLSLSGGPIEVTTLATPAGLSRLQSESKEVRPLGIRCATRTFSRWQDTVRVDFLEETSLKGVARRTCGGTPVLLESPSSVGRDRRGKKSV